MFPATTPSAEQVLESIATLVSPANVNQTLVSFPVQTQNHGTCGFANPKSSLEPLLFFLKLLDSKNKGIGQFNYEFLQSFNPEDLKSIKLEARKEYKAITKAIRDSEIHELLGEFQKKQPGTMERKIYLELFTAYLEAHYGQKTVNGHLKSSEKIKDELDRAQLILKSLNESEKREFLENFSPQKLPGVDLNSFNWWLSQGLSINSEFSKDLLLIIMMNLNKLEKILF